MKKKLACDSIESLPDGGRIYHYLIDGVLNSFPVPPDGFDPIHASDQELETYGFPPRPDPDSDSYDSWLNLVGKAPFMITPHDEGCLSVLLWIDVHKKLIVACLKKGGRQEVREFGTMTGEIKELIEWLQEAGCEIAAMESTGVYWKPLYNLFELMGLEVMVMNAAHMKAVPGRKTDVKDAEWIAGLLQRRLHAGHLHPRYQRYVERRRSKDGQLHGPDGVKIQKAKEEVPSPAPGTSLKFSGMGLVWVRTENQKI